MKKLLHFLFLLLAAHQLSAQAPGYLGKRFYVLGGGVFSVSGGPTANNKGLLDYYGDDGGGFGMNYHYGLQAGYAVSRYQAVTVMAGYLKTGMYTDAYTPSINYPFDGYEDYHELFYNLKGVSTGIGYQWFKTKKGAIAPFGMYGGVHLRATFVNGEILDKKTTYAYNDFNKQHGALGTDPKYLYWSAGFEFGQNAIIKDKVVLNYAVQFNLPIFQRDKIDTWLSESSDIYFDGTNHATYNQGIYKEDAAIRLMAHELFGVKLGLGLLLF